MTKLCVTFPWYHMERQSSAPSTHSALYNAAKTTWHSLAVRPPNETTKTKIKTPVTIQKHLVSRNFWKHYENNVDWQQVLLQGMNDNEGQLKQNTCTEMILLLFDSRGGIISLRLYWQKVRSCYKLLIDVNIPVKVDIKIRLIATLHSWPEA